MRELWRMAAGKYDAILANVGMVGSLLTGKEPAANPFAEQTAQQGRSQERIEVENSVAWDLFEKSLRDAASKKG